MSHKYKGYSFSRLIILIQIYTIDMTKFSYFNLIYLAWNLWQTSGNFRHYVHRGALLSVPQWHSRTPANLGWDQVPGESASPAWLATLAMNARDTTKVYTCISRLDTGCGPTLHLYIGSVTATTHQEKGKITLESNTSWGTVLLMMICLVL